MKICGFNNYLIVIKNTPTIAIIIEIILNLEIFSFKINHAKIVMKITEV